MTKSVVGWAIVNQNNLVCTYDGDSLLLIYRTKKLATASMRRHNKGLWKWECVVRVRIEEAKAPCRSGCTMIDDVPVFCRRHSVKACSQEGSKT